MLKKENLLVTVFGTLTAAFYLLIAGYGGHFDSIDSFLFREMSYSISPYSPIKSVTIPIYFLYNCSLLLFAFVLSLRLKNYYAKVGALHLAFASIISLALLRFPLDPARLSLTIQGVSHNLIVVLISLYIFASLLLFSQAFKHLRNLRWLAKYSKIIGVFLLLTSFITGIFALLSFPFFVGLFEKLPIGAFLGWILLTSFGMLQSDKRIKY